MASMACYHLKSTSRALYRVFVAPNLSKAVLPIHHGSTSSLVSRWPSFVPQTSVRLKTYKRKDTRRHAISDHYTLDTAIAASHINLVSETGAFKPNVPIDEALSSYNRVTHHLVQMSPGRVDEFGRSDPEHLPTCKIMLKMDLRAQHEKKLDIERRKAKGQGAGPSAKNLELNWGIGPHDLNHRLDKLRQFLSEGRKVEVLLGPRRHRRK